ncbi:hypothetical protein [Glaciihabitans sp. UYNi722]|uniref:hypothetical protein n=1 Tax=Glaciihabitans sp. UYNi722 TaxID=3156344 RepID=UPI00339902DA
MSVVVAVALAVLFVTDVLLKPAPATPIQGLEFHQSQAVPNFDDGAHDVTDPVKLAAFSTLVKKYSIDLTDFNTAMNDGCTGGLATSITVTFTHSASQKLRIYACGGDTAKGTFVSDATALFSQWRTDDKAQ